MIVTRRIILFLTLAQALGLFSYRKHGMLSNAHPPRLTFGTLFGIFKPMFFKEFSGIPPMPERD